MSKENILKTKKQYLEQQVPIDNIEKKALQNKISQLNKELKELQNRVIESESLRDSVFSLKEANYEVPEWATNLAKEHASNNIPVLLLSDIHYGEVINPNDLDNMNCYNTNVANKRLERLTIRTINKIKTTGNHKGIILLRGGDFVSGDIHQELKETNDLSSLPATKALAQQEIKMIEMFKKEFGNVWVISVVGNHGRNTDKPISKQNYQHNYDAITTMFLEEHFQNDSKVSFYTPTSSDALFKVYNFNFILTHGDRIGSRGGQGFLGPSATIARGQHKTIQYYNKQGKNINYLLMGHFHTPIQLENTIANGCVSGYSEYARDARLNPDAPSQTLFFINKDFGIVDVSKIYVSNIDEDLKIFYNQKANDKIKTVNTQPKWLRNIENQNNR